MDAALAPQEFAAHVAAGNVAGISYSRAKPYARVHAMQQPREVPDTGDCDSMSTRTVSSSRDARSATTTGPRRRGLAPQHVLHQPETSWRFLQATGDYLSKLEMQMDLLKKPDDAFHKPTLAAPSGPKDVSGASAILDDLVTPANVEEAERELLALLKGMKSPVTGQPEIATVPPPTQSRTSMMENRVSRTAARSTDTDASSVGQAVERSSRLAFLAKLPSATFVPTPRTMQLRSTRVTISDELRVKEASMLVPRAPPVCTNGSVAEIPNLVSSSQTAHNSPKNFRLRRSTHTSRQGTSCETEVESAQAVSTVSNLVAAVQPKSSTSDLDQLMAALQSGPSSTVSLVDPAIAAATSHSLQLKRVEVEVTSFSGDANPTNVAATRSALGEQLLALTQEDAVQRRLDRRDSVSASTSIEPGRPHAVPSHAPHTNSKGKLQRHPTASPASLQNTVDASMHHIVYHLLQDETQACEHALLDAVPLVENEALPVEEELTVRMDLQRHYLTLHPLDSIQVASNLPSCLQSTIATTASGAPVQLLSERNLGSTSVVASSVTNSIYTASVELDCVTYRQWHRSPGYVDPSSLVGTRDYEERCRLLAALRAKQREAEQKLGLVVSYTRIPPPLLHDDELIVPQAQRVDDALQSPADKTASAGSIAVDRSSPKKPTSLQNRQKWSHDAARKPSHASMGLTLATIQKLRLGHLEDLSSSAPGGSLLELFHNMEKLPTVANVIREADSAVILQSLQQSKNI